MKLIEFSRLNLFTPQPPSRGARKQFLAPLERGWGVTFLFLLLLPTLLFSQSRSRTQSSIGLRFASDFNYFHRGDETALVDNWFSTGVFGAFFRAYDSKKGAEIGVNINYKNSTGRGFPSLPVIMSDFDRTNTQNVGMTAFEMNFMVGPRFGWLHPRIGYILGYRVFDDGYYEAGTINALAINKLYFQLPFGLSMALPTNFGSVGFGATYELDLTNVMKVGNLNSTRGGRQHAINLEINVTYDTNR